MASLVLYWSVMIACYLLASRLRRYADRLGFVNTLLSVSVYALVFVMGLRMGANREVTDNLGVIGVQALLVTALTMAFSMLGAFAVRRAIPGRAGHTLIYQVYAGDWQPAGEAQLELAGSTIDELWASLCSQTILGTPEVENLDARIIRHTEIARLESEVDKLTRDHQRVKNLAQRNEIYAKLHKAKAQLAKLREA